MANPIAIVLSVLDLRNEIERLAGELLTPVGDWVASGNVPPSSPAAALQAGLRQACRIYATVPPVISAVTNSELFYEPLCRPYLGGATPVSSVPFRGGQCNVTYVVSRETTYSNGVSTGINDLTSLVGPISGIQAEIVPIFPGATTNELKWRITGADQTVTASDPPLGFQISPVSYSSVSVRRQDGQPDNCGDLPRSPQPTGVPVPPPPSPVRPPGTPENYRELPQVVINNDLSISIDFPESARPGYRIEPPPSGSPPSPPSLPNGNRPIPPAPGAQEPANPDGNSAPPGRLIDAVITRAVSAITPPPSQYSTGTGDVLYAPRLGNVQFLSASGLERSIPIPIQVDGQCTQCPFPSGASAVFVGSTWGVDFNVELLTFEVTDE